MWFTRQIRHIATACGTGYHLYRQAHFLSLPTGAPIEIDLAMRLEDIDAAVKSLPPRIAAKFEDRVHNGEISHYNVGAKDGAPRALRSWLERRAEENPEDPYVRAVCEWIRNDYDCLRDLYTIPPQCVLALSGTLPPIVWPPLAHCKK